MYTNKRSITFKKEEPFKVLFKFTTLSTQATHDTCEELWLPNLKMIISIHS